MSSAERPIGIVPFNEDEDNPASRMRGFEVARALSRLGVRAAIVEPEQVSDCSVLILGRYARYTYGRWRALLREARRTGTKVVLDLADNIFAWRRLSCQAVRHLPASRRLPRCLKFWWEQRVMLDVVRGADHVTTSSRPLMDLASRYTSRCSVIPDIVGGRYFEFCKEHGPRERVRVLWTGYRDNLPHAEVLFEALKRIGGQHRFELCVVTSEMRTSPYRGTKSNRETVAGLPFQTCFIPWDRDRACEDLFTADIGVAPLQPDSIKSANKIVVFMAMGIPVVASPNYEYQQLVENGSTGFICSSPEEWAEALDGLIGSEKLRAEMGAAGRRAIWSTHRPVAIGQQWKALIASLGTRRS